MAEQPLSPSPADDADPSSKSSSTTASGLPAEPTWEDEHVPPAQRNLNQFCENWIFALIVAMVIRHFFLEAYRIPTASMEPMLYGDEAITKGDFVLVDKVGFRFTGADRWDVTVFQFPWPEIKGPRGNAVSAWNPEGHSRATWPYGAEMHRNFVKRVVAMPGDAFYIMGGDIYLQQGDGSWQIPTRPPQLMAEQWQTIYQQGAQAGYLPWSGAGGAQVNASDQGVRFSPAGGTVSFNQPLRNVYIKEGDVNVLPGVIKAGGHRLGTSNLQMVPVSMTKPVFTYDLNGRSIKGTIWELDDWQVRRVTTKDLDNQSYGTSLNDVAREWIGDIRAHFVVAEIADSVTLSWGKGDAEQLDVVLSTDRWQINYAGNTMASGEGSMVGSRWRVQMLDNKASVWLNDALLTETELQPLDPNQHRRWWQVTGPGILTLAGLALDRDIHYSVNGFLADETQDHINRMAQIAAASVSSPIGIGPRNGQNSGNEKGNDQDSEQGNGATLNLALRLHHGVELYKIRHNREQLLATLLDQELGAQRLQALQDYHDYGGNDLSWLQPIATGPDNAIRVPDQAYLLLGDNSIHSLDSRNWGYVPEANMRGTAIAAYLPWWNLRGVD